MDKFLNRCDKVIAFCFYATIFFLPIASAITEGLFTVMILTYVVKRGAVFISKFKELVPEEKKDLDKVFGLFFLSFKPVDNPLNFPVALYLLISIISVVLSEYFAVSFKGFFFKLLQGAFTYFLFIEVINSKKKLKIFLGVFLSSITLISINGVFQYFVRHEFIHQYLITDGRVTSSFKHANDLGAYLVMVIPMLFCLAARFNSSLKKKELKGSLKDIFSSKRFRFFIVILFFLSVFCLGLTYSRGAWVGFVASIIFLAWKKPRLFMPLISALLVFLVVFFIKMGNERKTNVSHGWGLLNSSSRILYWDSVLRVIDEHPLFGVGTNAYSAAAKDFPERIYWRGYPHNCYLHIAAETGVLGLALFIFLMYRLFVYGVDSLNKLKDASAFSMLLGLLAGFAGLLVHSFFDTSFYSVQLDTLFWLMIGFIVAVPNIYLQRT